MSRVDCRAAEVAREAELCALGRGQQDVRTIGEG